MRDVSGMKGVRSKGGAVRSLGVTVSQLKAGGVFSVALPGRSSRMGRKEVVKVSDGSRKDRSRVDGLIEIDPKFAELASAWRPKSSRNQGQTDARAG